MALLINLHDNVVDGNVNEFYKETDEAHDCKAHSCCQGNLLELWQEEEEQVSQLTQPLPVPRHLPLISGFVHLLTNLMESFAKSFSGFTYCWI